MKKTAILALLALAATPLHADDDEITTELKSNQDPTILKRRAWLDTEWNKFDDESHNVEFTLAGLWAWRISEKQDWALRLKVPLELHVAGDSAGDTDQQGLGDVRFAGGTAYRFSKTVRAGGGLEMRFPTATDEDLGDDVWRLQEFGTIAWDVTEWFTLSPSVEINQSVAKEADGSDQNFIELFLPGTVFLPRHWSVTASYEPKVDFERDNEWSHAAKAAIGKGFEKLPLGFLISFKKPFDGGPKDFQINFVMTYYFR